MNFMGPVIFLFACLQIPYRMIEYSGILKENHLWERIQQGQYPLMWIVLAGLAANWIWRVT